MPGKKNVNKRGVNSYFFRSRTLTNVGGYLEETSNLFAGVRLENDFQNAEENAKPKYDYYVYPNF